MCSVFDVIEQYAPGFRSSVIGRDILTPPDLENTFGLTGGVRSRSCGLLLIYGIYGELSVILVLGAS